MSKGEKHAADIRQRLASYFHDQADWRDRKAEEYPDDARNRTSAEGLTALAEYVLGLGVDDPRLLVLDALYHGPDEMYVPWDAAKLLTSRFRFDDPNEGCDEFLTRFSEAEESDTAEAIRDGVLDGGEE